MTSKAWRARFAVRFSLAVLAAAAGTSGSARASVPATVTQQGRLLDSSGTPITNQVNIVFTIYDAATAGTNLWTETHTVTPDNGYFSVQLGDTNTTAIASVFDGSTRYLGVTVGSDPEMTPRETISSVPYAFHAGTADSAATASSATNVAWTGITGFPAPCAAPQFLRGFDASGNPQCAAPALSCTTRSNATTSASTSISASCNSGEVSTGGGCSTDGSLTYAVSGYPGYCFSGNYFFPCTYDQYCATSAAANTTAYARCCVIQ